MPERTTKQKMLQKVDVNRLLRHFTSAEIALVFGCATSYIHKTVGLQKIIIGEPTENDEMKFGRIGAWKNSKERKFLEENFMLDNQNNNNNYKSE